MNQMSFMRKTLNTLAGEGNFHSYRMLHSRKRGLLFAKSLAVTLSFALNRGEVASQKAVVFVKGKNQLRYQSFLAEQLQKELGKCDVFTSSRLPLDIDRSSLGGFSLSALVRQATLLTLMLVTGRRRYLNLYLLAFQVEIDRIVNKSFEHINTFLCFNDQPYDVAAILNSLHNKKRCRTIVVQHGLILSEQFYFPTVAREFWAWGELSKRHYRSWSRTGSIFIKGRYIGDEAKKGEHLVMDRPIGEPLKILIAPSHIHIEVQDIVLGVKSILPEFYREKTTFAIKFHPATKFKSWLKFRCWWIAPSLNVETAPMEALAERYDALITKNSTSAIDFLLRGKPVFFHPAFNGADFPSSKYGFTLLQLKNLVENRTLDVNDKNVERMKLLKDTLNV